MATARPDLVFPPKPIHPIPFPRAAHGQPLTLRPALPLLVRHTLPVRDNGNMRHIVIISPASERTSERALEGREKFVYLHRIACCLSLASLIPYALTSSSFAAFI